MEDGMTDKQERIRDQIVALIWAIRRLAEKAKEADMAFSLYAPQGADFTEVRAAIGVATMVDPQMVSDPGPGDAGFES
jgi:hypothetical protein